MMDQELAEMPLDDIAPEEEEALETVPVPSSMVPHLSETAVLLDIDGTLLDLMPTPREVWVPPGLARTLNRLYQRTGGARALVSGRSLNGVGLVVGRGEVGCPRALARTLNRLYQRTGGALALVSGRSLNDIDLIFAPDVFPAVGGHGAGRRVGGGE